MKKKKIPLLARVAIAILLGIALGKVMPLWLTRVFTTFNSLFGNFLGFIIPLIIIGLVTPAIGKLGKGAGKLLLITTIIAYGSTLFSGFFTYFSCQAIYPSVIAGSSLPNTGSEIEDTLLTPLPKIGRASCRERV